ncbi:PQQ-binding-like beta-propeller repeat protein [Streptomyces xiaopingdaonensis]|uniref:outer membrane protein assembly factor BamB family protein n=1 Tax=Streptomyces xiaopingdaonensis TaxID=1565415 RepID=UPI0002ED93EF|nr:PQQ-binding-like beta-propeller repeat protein [Streptomyces xiaopingdaonensis]
MSQPPPPPNQPPSGGFGAPQGPDSEEPSANQPPQPPQAPPPAGAPAPPPGPPPQAPPGGPQAPPPAGGFGAPQQPPPGGYGYPQQPPPPAGYGYPQGGYGYPQQAPPGALGYPTPPPGGKPGGGGSNKLIAIIASAVAVVLIAGVAVFFVTRDDDGSDESKGDDKGSSQGASGEGDRKGNVKAKEIVSLDAPEVKTVTSVVGGWATDKVFAKSSVNEVVGFSLPDGEEKWRLDLKGGVCAASNEKTSDGKVAAIVQETVSSSAKCTRMVVIDLNAGKLVWDKDLPGSTTTSAENVAISGDTVAAAWIGGSVAYSISSGNELWSGKPSNCRDTGYAGGDELAVVVECGSFSSSQITVQKLDPKTGKATMKFKAPKGVQTARIASTKPLTLVVGAGTSLPTDVMTVDDNGKLKAKVTIGKRYNKPCSTEVNSCHTMAVGKDAFYLSTTEHAGSSDSGRTNEVMAFDWATGKAEWKASAGEKRTIVPIKTEGDDVIAYKLPAYSVGGEIVKLDAAQGKETVQLKMPVSDVGKGEQAISIAPYSARTPIIYENNRLFLLEKLISERRDHDRDKRKLAVGFAAD